MHNFLYTLAGLVAGIALMFFLQGGDKPSSAGPDQPATTAHNTTGQSPLSTNPFDPSSKTPSGDANVLRTQSNNKSSSADPVGKDDTRSTNDRQAQTPQSDAPYPDAVSNYRDLAGSLQWLEQASTDDIASAMQSLIQGGLSFDSPDRIYKTTWIHALYTRWLETDTSSAIDYVLDEQSVNTTNPAEMQLRGTAFEVLSLFANDQPALVSEALSQIDQSRLTTEHHLMSLLMQVDPEAGLAQLENAVNPEIRMGLQFEYAQQLFNTDPQAAIEWVNARNENNPELQRYLGPDLYYQWAEQDPRAMLAYLDSGNAGQLLPEVRVGAYIALGRESPLEAMDLIAQMPGAEAETARLSVLSDWSYSDPSAASAWLAQALGNGEIVPSRIPPHMLTSLPQATALEITAMLPEQQRQEVYFALGQNAYHSAPGVFQQLIDALPDEPARQVASLAQLGERAESDPLGALDQLVTLSWEMQLMLVYEVVSRANYAVPGVVDEWMQTASIPDDLKPQIEGILREQQGSPYGRMVPPFYHYQDEYQMVIREGEVLERGELDGQ